MTRKATASQRTFYGVEEAIVLAPDRPNSRLNDLIVHPHALPRVIEWPTYDYYKVNGMFLPQPEFWNAGHTASPPVVDYNFSTRSPIKAFKPKFNHRMEK